MTKLALADVRTEDTVAIFSRPDYCYKCSRDKGGLVTTLAEALEAEHRVIDEGIERFLAAPAADDAPSALRTSFAGLRRHIYLEEEIAFPPLQDAGFVGPILVMLNEHGKMWDVMTEVERLLAAGDVTSAAELVRGRLTALLASHNPKEERILYPQLDSALEQPHQEALREFVAVGRLPDGWACARAGSTPAASDAHPAGDTR